MLCQENEISFWYLLITIVMQGDLVWLKKFWVLKLLDADSEMEVSLTNRQILLCPWLPTVYWINIDMRKWYHLKWPRTNVSHLERFFQAIKIVRMHPVRVIATMIVLLMVTLTYLFLYEDSLSSFLKLNFSVWYSFISMECWIRFVHMSVRRRVIQLWNHWFCLTLLGIFNIHVCVKLLDCDKRLGEKSYNVCIDILFSETDYDG